MIGGVIINRGGHHNTKLTPPPEDPPQMDLNGSQLPQQPDASIAALREQKELTEMDTVSPLQRIKNANTTVNTMQLSAADARTVLVLAILVGPWSTLYASCKAQHPDKKDAACKLGTL